MPVLKPHLLTVRPYGAAFGPGIISPAIRSALRLSRLRSFFTTYISLKPKYASASRGVFPAAIIPAISGNDIWTWVYSFLDMIIPPDAAVLFFCIRGYFVYCPFLCRPVQLRNHINKGFQVRNIGIGRIFGINLRAVQDHDLNVLRSQCLQRSGDAARLVERLAQIGNAALLIENLGNDINFSIQHCGPLQFPRFNSVI